MDPIAAMPRPIFNGQRGIPSAPLGGWISMAALMVAGSKVQAAQAPLDPDLVLAVDRYSISGCDRWATDIDLEERGAPRSRSDTLLWPSACALFALLIDRHVRGEWKRVLPLYADVIFATNALRS